VFCLPLFSFSFGLPQGIFSFPLLFFSSFGRNRGKRTKGRNSKKTLFFVPEGVFSSKGRNSKKTLFFVPEGVFSSPLGSLFPSGKKSPLGKAKRKRRKEGKQKQIN
jgi:hypothetical protein